MIAPMRGVIGIGMALLAGLLFGAGLSVSRMIDPAVVLAFLDVAAIPGGNWDGSLALVMAAAVGVTLAGYRLVLRRATPLFAPAFQVPTTRIIDGRLIGGALLFGLGWGLVGYCPGPALAGIGLGALKTWVFVGAMTAGMLLYRLVTERRGTGGAPVALSRK